MHFFKLIAIATAVSAGLLAQNSPAPPVQAKRLPPEKPKGKPSSATDNLIDRYDFGAQINALEETNSLRPGAQTVNPMQNSTPASLASGESAVPAGFKPRTDVQLTKTALEAVQMSEKWMSEHNQPAVGRDGRVLYSYGAGLPTVVCAPLRVCMIELQSGEKLVGEPQIGDSVRWNLSPAMYGSGASSTSVIVLKPQEILRERIRADIAEARLNGKHLGRPLTVGKKASKIRKLHLAGVSKAEIARQLDIGRTSVRRILATYFRKK